MFDHTRTTSPRSKGTSYYLEMLHADDNDVTLDVYITTYYVLLVNWTLSLVSSYPLICIVLSCYHFLFTAYMQTNNFQEHFTRLIVLLLLLVKSACLM